MTFLFVSLSYTAECAIVTAFITFIPKFIESQFGIPASNASIYTGKGCDPRLVGQTSRRTLTHHHHHHHVQQPVKKGVPAAASGTGALIIGCGRHSEG